MSSAVGRRIGEHLQAEILPGEQFHPDDSFVVVGAAGLAQRRVGDDSGAGFDRDVGFAAILAAVHGLVHVAGLGIDCGDHSIGGHLPGDAPASVGAIGALDRLDILAGVLDAAYAAHPERFVRKPDALDAELDRIDSTALLAKMELPVQLVLADMESACIAVDLSR